MSKLNSLEALSVICQKCGLGQHCFYKDNNKRCIEYDYIEKDLKAFENLVNILKKKVLTRMNIIKEVLK